jgi:hypothetical protein
MCNIIQNAISSAFMEQICLQVHEGRKCVFIIRARRFHASEIFYYYASHFWSNAQAECLSLSLYISSPWRQYYCVYLCSFVADTPASYQLQKESRANEGSNYETPHPRTSKEIPWFNINTNQDLTAIWCLLRGTTNRQLSTTVLWFGSGRCNTCLSRLPAPAKNNSLFRVILWRLYWNFSVLFHFHEVSCVKEIYGDKIHSQFTLLPTKKFLCFLTNKG